MSRIFQTELLKTWSKKSFWVLIAALTAVNIFLLWYSGSSKNEPSPAVYQKLSQDLHGKSEEQKSLFISNKLETLKNIQALIQINNMEADEQSNFYKNVINSIKSKFPNCESYRTVYQAGSYLSYTDSLENEIAFVSQIYDEIKKVSGYSANLDRIKIQAKKLSLVSVFGGTGNNNFSSRNILKTASDFEKMRDVKIKYCVTKGLTGATSFAVTDIIAILFMLFLSMLLMYEEKDKGLFSIIRPTPKGRAATITAKWLVLGVNMLLVTVFLFGANLLYMGITYGLPDMSVSLQSVPAFTGSTLPLTIGHYLLLFFFSKFAAYFTLSVFVLLISLYTVHPVITSAVSGALLILEYVLYVTIPAISGFNILKYINLISFVSTNGLYENYLNLNLFGYPVNLIFAIWISLMTTFFLLTTVLIIAFCKKRNFSSDKNLLEILQFKLPLPRIKHSANISRYELYKLLYVNKAAFVLILFISLQWYVNKDMKYYYPDGEAYYKMNMINLQGALTPEKENYLKTEQKKFDDASASLQALKMMESSGKMTKQEVESASVPFQKILQRKPIFERVLNQYHYIQKNPSAWFVYDTGYNRLFGITPNDDNLCSFLLILLSILCFSSLFPMEHKNGAIRLIQTTPLGQRHTSIRKIWCSVIVLIPIFIAVYLPDLLLIKETFFCPFAPVISLPAFSHFPRFLPIWGYMLLLLLTRFTATVILLLFVLWSSKLIKSSILTMLISSLLLAVPVILYFMNIRFLYSITLLPVLTANGIYTRYYSSVLTGVYIAVPFAIGLISIFGILDIKPNRYK